MTWNKAINNIWGKKEISMRVFSVAEKMPEEYTRIIALNNDGWCIGDLFWGLGGTNIPVDEWNPEGSWAEANWRYADSQRLLNKIATKVAYWAELPSIEELIKE